MIFPHKSYFSLLVLISASGVSQNPAARATAAVGFVTGTVYYADTNLPARVDLRYVQQLASASLDRCFVRASEDRSHKSVPQYP